MKYATKCLSVSKRNEDALDLLMNMLICGNKFLCCYIQDCQRLQ